MNRFLHGMVRAVAETYELPGPILEVGACQVAGQESLAELRPLFPGRAYIGLDQQPGPGVDRVGDIEDLPFADSSFGSVLALNTLEHVVRFWRGLEEIERVLRPDGVVLLSCPFYFHIHNYPADYWRFTPAALMELLRGYPQRIVGWQGPRSRPLHVWALAARPEHPPWTEAQLQRYRTLLGQYARQPLPWSKRLRYRLAKLLCGGGPLAPYLEQEQWETVWQSTSQPAVSV